MIDLKVSRVHLYTYSKHPPGSEVRSYRAACSCGLAYLRGWRDGCDKLAQQQPGPRHQLQLPEEEPEAAGTAVETGHVVGDHAVHKYVQQVEGNLYSPPEEPKAMRCNEVCTYEVAQDCPLNAKERRELISKVKNINERMHKH